MAGIAWYDVVIGIIIIVISVIITIIVLMQQSREAGLSGSIAGGSSDTFYGKNKGRTKEAKLSKLTKILATVFFIFTLVATMFLGFMSSSAQ
ncbi:MAG: preprotein translocase subunit SecG [Clostridia bacterium]|nr:preprotein translocase subunit SecG [Clostridia bacterium]